MVLAKRERKLCVRCGLKLEHLSANGVLRSWCSDCLNKSNIKTKAKNPAKYLAMRVNAHLIRKYGITLDQYNILLSGQNGVCAICQKPPGSKRLHVDHDHKTRKIRGLLCDKCNRAIGLLDDDFVRMKRASMYIIGNLYLGD